MTYRIDPKKFSQHHQKNPIVFASLLPLQKVCFKLLVAPQIGYFSFDNEAANAGDMATVQCAVTKGDLPIDIAWSLNGQAIGNDYLDIVVSRSSKRASTLTIDSVAARHAGEYICSASNAAGFVTHSATLTVNGTTTQEEYAQSSVAH